MPQYMLPFYRTSTIIISVAFLCFGISCTKQNTPSQAPHASFTYTSARNFPVSIQFTDQTVYPPGVFMSWLWNFGDGSISTLHNPLHVFLNAGTYVVKLITTQQGPGGIKDSASQIINLNLAGPSGNSTRTATASFSFVIVNDIFTTTFVNGSTNASSYLWEFGDGSSSTSGNSTVTKNYQAPGTYHVKLTATGPGGVDTCGATIIF
jgi:PKD repeat protein